MVIRSEDAIARFENFLTQPKYRHLIVATADQYPTERSIYVDYKEIENHDMDLADHVLKEWRDAEIHANTVIESKVPPDLRLKGVKLNFRVINLPKKFNISKLRTSEQGQLIAMEGLIRRVTEVKPRIVVGVYECRRCGGIIKEPQETWHPREPLECYKEQNGCGRMISTTRFKLSFDLSEYVDSQKIEIQEPPESTTPGAQPQRIACYMEQDIVGLVNPGDRIIVNGIRTPRQRSFPMKSTILDTYINVNSIETQERVYDEIEITTGDEKEIIALSQDPRCCQKIVQSIIPTIYGMQVEKEAIALQLFGGIAKDMPDGTRLRGDIHILLVGDPGTAKSTIMRRVAKIAPRGIYASGKSTTGPGLIAAVVKDDFGEGRWTVEAGAMALADRGQLCVDELDKMRQEDRDNMHEAMAQQEVYISKAGIHSMVHTRCPVLAAANPKEGRFDPTNYLVAQIKMPPTLLSRFDLIFPIMDVPDPEHDTQVAKHILEGTRVGQYRAYASTVGGDEHSEDKDSTTIFEPTIEPEPLRKYIAYAKRNIAPVMDQEAMQRILDYYVDMRKGSGGEDTVAITPRQLQAVVRLSEASARMHLSNTIDIGRDVDRAIRIMQYYLKKLASEDGRFDIDLIETGTSHAQRENIKTIRDIIAEIAAVEQPVLHKDIILDAERSGIDRGKAEAIITRLTTEEGYMYETDQGSKKYRVVRG